MTPNITTNKTDTCFSSSSSPSSPFVMFVHMILKWHIMLSVGYFWGTWDSLYSTIHVVSPSEHVGFFGLSRDVWSIAFSAGFICNFLDTAVDFFLSFLGNDWWGRPRWRRWGQRAGVLEDNEEDESLLNLLSVLLVVFFKLHLWCYRNNLFIQIVRLYSSFFWTWADLFSV